MGLMLTVGSIFFVCVDDALHNIGEDLDEPKHPSDDQIYRYEPVDRAFFHVVCAWVQETIPRMNKSSK